MENPDLYKKMANVNVSKYESVKVASNIQCLCDSSKRISNNICHDLFNLQHTREQNNQQYQLISNTIHYGNKQ